MKKTISLLGLLLVFTTGMQAQEKPPIDFTAIQHWQTIVSSQSISNNGKYFAHRIGNLLGSGTMHVQSLDGSWKFQMAGVNELTFSEDSRRAFFTLSDTLHILTLGSSKVEVIPGVSYSLFLVKGQEFLALTTPAHTLTLRNLSTGKTQEFKDVVSFVVSKELPALWLTMSNTDTIPSIRVAILKKDQFETTPRIIWQGVRGATAGNLTFGGKGNLAAFTVDRPGMAASVQRSFWLSKNMGEAQEIVSDKTAIYGGLGDNSNVRLSSINRFTADGNRLFINIEEPTPAPVPKNALGLNVWSWHDQELQSAQLKQYYPANSDNYRGDIQQYVAILDIKNKKVIRLQEKSKTEGMRVLMHAEVDDEVIVHDRPTKDNAEDYWLKSVRPRYWLVSTWNATKKPSPVCEPEYMREDPRYIIGSDTIMSNYFSNDVLVYNRLNGDVVNVTKNIIEPADIRSMHMFRSRGLSFRWKVREQEQVVISNPYDYWLSKLGPDSQPVALMAGFGRKNKIHLQHVSLRPGGQDNLKGDLGMVVPGKLVLSGFSDDTKEMGFYLMDPAKPGAPELLSKGPFFWGNGGAKFASSVLKARDAKVFVLQRDSAGHSSNWVWTTDFKSFRQLTFNYPEKAYAWYTKELITYKGLDGKTNQAMLYKPESFDPAKKYPVLFNYYEERTHHLNAYQAPFSLSAPYDIACWFVSRGYVVCVPDVMVTPGVSGEVALNAVVGAANYLEKNFAWVDPKRMGIAGHSYGGYSTNYIITHSNRFAAAHTGAGLANLTSTYGDILLTTGASGLRALMEMGQIQMGQTLWENRKLYIDRSPIFNADKITTPLLMMHNDKDGACAFADAVQFFTALRRLGKKAWMLQYDGEYHSIMDPDREKDYTIRMTQFFDHYLKGAPAPKWMTRGVPAALKGIEDRLELDNDITNLP
jgi:dienelactone hydrolase